MRSHQIHVHGMRQIDVMREQAPKLVLGVHFSHNSGMSSRRGRASGTIIYLDELFYSAVRGDWSA